MYKKVELSDDLIRGLFAHYRSDSMAGPAIIHGGKIIRVDENRILSDNYDEKSNIMANIGMFGFVEDNGGQTFVRKYGKMLFDVINSKEIGGDPFIIPLEVRVPSQDSSKETMTFVGLEVSNGKGTIDDFLDGISSEEIIPYSSIEVSVATSASLNPAIAIMGQFASSWIEIMLRMYEGIIFNMRRTEKYGSSFQDAEATAAKISDFMTSDKPEKLTLAARSSGILESARAKNYEIMFPAFDQISSELIVSMNNKRLAMVYRSDKEISDYIGKNSPIYIIGSDSCNLYEHLLMKKLLSENGIVQKSGDIEGAIDPDKEESIAKACLLRYHTIAFGRKFSEDQAFSIFNTSAIYAMLSEKRSDLSNWSEKALGIKIGLSSLIGVGNCLISSSRSPFINEITSLSDESFLDMTHYLYTYDPSKSLSQTMQSVSYRSYTGKSSGYVYSSQSLSEISFIFIDAVRRGKAIKDKLKLELNIGPADALYAVFSQLAINKHSKSFTFDGIDVYDANNVPDQPSYYEDACGKDIGYRKECGEIMTDAIAESSFGESSQACPNPQSLFQSIKEICSILYDSMLMPTVRDFNIKASAGKSLLEVADEYASKVLNCNGIKDAVYSICSKIPSEVDSFRTGKPLDGTVKCLSDFLFACNSMRNPYSYCPAKSSGTPPDLFDALLSNSSGYQSPASMYNEQIEFGSVKQRMEDCLSMKDMSSGQVLFLAARFAIIKDYGPDVAYDIMSLLLFKMLRMKGAVREKFENCINMLIFRESPFDESKRAQYLTAVVRALNDSLSAPAVISKCLTFVQSPSRGYYYGGSEAWNGHDQDSSVGYMFGLSIKDAIDAIDADPQLKHHKTCIDTALVTTTGI